MYVSHLEYKMKEYAPYQYWTCWYDHVEDWVIASWSEQPAEICKDEGRNDKDRWFIQFQTVFYKESEG